MTYDHIQQQILCNAHWPFPEQEEKFDIIKRLDAFDEFDICDPTTGLSIWYEGWFGDQEMPPFEVMYPPLSPAFGED